MLMITPRYPDIQVALRSRNPFALVSAVRLALRRSGVEQGEILRFTEKALSVEQPERMREICSEWARISTRSC